MMVIIMVMMLANFMAMTYIMTMIIIADQVDDGYEDDDVENFYQGRNILYNHEYDDNLSQVCDNGCDLENFQVRVIKGMM